MPGTLPATERKASRLAGVVVGSFCGREADGSASAGIREMTMGSDGPSLILFQRWCALQISRKGRGFGGPAGLSGYRRIRLHWKGTRHESQVSGIARSPAGRRARWAKPPAGGGLATLKASPPDPATSRLEAHLSDRGGYAEARSRIALRGRLADSQHGASGRGGAGFRCRDSFLSPDHDVHGRFVYRPHAQP